LTVGVFCIRHRSDLWAVECDSGGVTFNVPKFEKQY